LFLVGFQFNIGDVADLEEYDLLGRYSKTNEFHVYGISSKMHHRVTAEELRDYGWTDEKWHKDLLPNFDCKQASLTKQVVNQSAQTWAAKAVTEGYYTFSLDGNSCHFDTFLEQMYWLRERVQQPLFIGIESPWREMRPLFDGIHEAHMVAEVDRQARLKMNRLRRQLRHDFITAAMRHDNTLDGLHPQMGATVNWWYRLQDAGLGNNTVFGSWTTARHCAKDTCGFQRERPTEEWRMQAVDVCQFDKAVQYKLLRSDDGINPLSRHASKMYYAADLIQALRGCPRMEIGGRCSECGGPCSHIWDSDIADVMVMINESRTAHDGTR